MKQGFRHFKLKAGLGIEADRRRLGFVREIVGDEGILMVDVNQLWDVDEAIEYMKQLADLKLWCVCLFKDQEGPVILGLNGDPTL